MPFPITCAACHKTFSIADDVFERKVKGRVVTIKCKQCQSGIRVDGTKDTPVFSVADSVRPPPVAAVDALAVARDPLTAATPAVAPPTPPAVNTNAPLATQNAPRAVSSATAASTAIAEQPAITAIVGSKAAAAATPIAAKANAAATPIAAKANATATPIAAKAGAPTTTAAARTSATGSAPKTAPAAASAKSATAAPLTKTVAVASSAKAPTATTPKGVTRTPLAAAAGAGKPVVTPKAPGVAQAAKATAPSPVAKLEPASITKPEPPAPVTAAPTHVPEAEELAAKVPLAAPPASAESLWAVDYPDGEDRELTLGEIEKELAAGTIDLSTLVWREGMAEWLELGQLPELRALPAAVVPPPPAPAPLQRPRAPSAPAVETGLSTTLPQPNLPSPPQRPPAPSAPVIDFARHDAQKAAPPAPIPKPPPPFATSGDSRPPTPPVFAPGAPAIPASTAPAFPVVAQAAPVVAASVPARANPSGVAPVANVEDWPQKSRAPIVIGAVALLAVGGLVFFLTRSSGDELPPPVPISALPGSVPSTPHAAEPEPTPETAKAAQPSPGSGAAMQPPGSQPISSPNAGFAELFASGARSADEKSGVSGPGRRFDPAVAKGALAAVANQTADCRERGGPTGKATVVVTFDPSGKVSSATVSDAPFAGTSSGACIAGTMKRATVPAFSGLPGTATQIISIQ